MSTNLDPRVSIFETDAEAASYDLWFRGKVEAALSRADDPATARYSSDQVLREVDLTIKAVQSRHASRRLA